MRIICAMTAVACAAAMAGDVVLFDAATANVKSVRAQDGASFELKDGLLTVKTAPSDAYPGVCVFGNWDLSGCGRVEVEFVNGGIYGRYTLRLLNAGGVPAGKGSKIFKLPIRGEKHAVIGADFPPDLPELDAIVPQLKPVRVWAIPYLVWAPFPKPGESPDRRAPVGGVGTLDRSAVRQVAVYINKPLLPHTWSVRRIVAKAGDGAASAHPVPAWAKMKPDQFFPFIDEYGQFKHREWPDKVHADADLARQRAKEEADLAAHPGPKGWDKWGGWADGPQLPKTGGFSTTKWNGKWWIVDPDGHLWWSHGPVRVTPSCATTPLDDHDHWFARLPAKGDPEAEFYSTRDKLLFPYYARWKKYRIYDFSAQNIARK